MSPNTLRAYGYDLRYLFTFLAREDLDYREFRPPDALRPLGFAQPQDCAAARSDGGVGRGGPARAAVVAGDGEPDPAAVSSFYDWAVLAEEYDGEASGEGEPGNTCQRIPGDP